MAGHDVGVPLDDHRTLLLRDRLAREVDAVEHLRLLVDRGLGGVEVLRAVVVVEELAGAEADGVARQVADRPHQPAAEAVVDAAVALRHQPGSQHLLLAEPPPAQVGDERVPPLRGEADAERRRGRLVEAPRPEELAAGGRVRAGERLDVERRRDLVRLDQARALPLLPARCRAALLVAQRHAGASRELLDRLGEGEMVDLAQEVDDVAALGAAEAVPEALAGGHVERRGALLVEGAQPLEAAAAGPLEGDVLAHHLVDAGPLAHQRDVLVADAGHGRDPTGGPGCPLAVVPASRCDRMPT